jgi:5-(carboxyamino)imidazole ribonucleotide synthase
LSVVTNPVVGMIGGGQLARMTHQAGIALGIRFRVLTNTSDDSAAQVVRDLAVGDYRDLDALREFALGCDVVTFDHEHVPAAHLRALEAGGVVLRPGADALLHAQDKSIMRSRLTERGVPCPRWRQVTDVCDVAELGEECGWPMVLKATRGGYDGKGVWMVETYHQAVEVIAWAAARGIGLLAEERVPFLRELSVLVARSPHGQAAVYPVVETVQVDGVCREVYAPAPGISEEHAVAAQQTALRIAGILGVTGVMAVEMFDAPDGVYVNELAMRPHNSGHWTIEGARTSQFEQHLRAVLDLPLGSPRPVAPYAVMVNVLGGDEPDMYSGYLHCMARDPDLKIHMYGKEVKPGRKIGHVAVIGDDLDDCRERARHAAAYLRGDISG